MSVTHQDYIHFVHWKQQSDSEYTIISYVYLIHITQFDVDIMNFFFLTASVHLPRIGHATKGFNWYGTERLIRKHLASRGIPTYMYPFIILMVCTFSSEGENVLHFSDAIFKSKAKSSSAMFFTLPPLQ